MSELVAIRAPYGRPHLQSYRLRAAWGGGKWVRLFRKWVPPWSPWQESRGAPGQANPTISGGAAPKRLVLSQALPVFDRLRVGSGLTVQVVPSRTPSLVVSASEDVIDKFTLDFEGTRLHLRLSPSRLGTRSTRDTFRVRLSVPALREIEASEECHVVAQEVPARLGLSLSAFGSSSLRWVSSAQQKPVELELSNASSHLCVEGTWQHVLLESTGGHSILKGAAHTAELYLSQESQLDGEASPFYQADLRLSASQARVVASVLARGTATLGSRLCLLGDGALDVQSRDDSEIVRAQPDEGGMQALTPFSSSAGVA